MVVATHPIAYKDTFEILLIFNRQDYEEAGRCLQVLKGQGAPSNTAAIMDALRLASSMTPSTTEEGK